MSNSCIIPKTSNGIVLINMKLLIKSIYIFSINTYHSISENWGSSRSAQLLIYEVSIIIPNLNMKINHHPTQCFSWPVSEISLYSRPSPKPSYSNQPWGFEHKTSVGYGFLNRRYIQPKFWTLFPLFVIECHHIAPPAINSTGY